MKEHIIRAILYEDMSVKWKNAEELKDDVNVHLNVHQKTRQFVEVELGDFLLNDGEWVRAAFEMTVGNETNHINPTAMDKIVVEGKTVFRLQIPTLVHNTPGKWGLYFDLVTNYNPATGEYDDSYPFDAVKFSEYSSFIDDGLTVPSYDNLSAIYTQANTALSAANEALETTENAVIEVQEKRYSALNDIQEAQEYAVSDIRDEEQKSLKTIQEAAAESARETMNSVGLILRGAQGQPTFFIREGRLYVRIIKGSVNPYRIENGRLKMTIVKEVI